MPGFTRFLSGLRFLGFGASRACQHSLISTFQASLNVLSWLTVSTLYASNGLHGPHCLILLQAGNTTKEAHRSYLYQPREMINYVKRVAYDQVGWCTAVPHRHNAVKMRSCFFLVLNWTRLNLSYQSIIRNACGQCMLSLQYLNHPISLICGH